MLTRFISVRSITEQQSHRLKGQQKVIPCSGLAHRVQKIAGTFFLSATF